MSFQELHIRLEQIAAELDAKMPDLIATQSMVEFEAEWKDRIFGKGLNSENSNIGVYSDKADYFSKEKFIRKAAFKPIGKTGKKTKSTMYLPGGYSEFRGIQGRQNQKVNLKFGGSMERAFRVYKFGNEVLFGNADEAESKKVQGNTARFGNWAEATQQESEMLKESIADKAIIVTKK